MAQNAGALYGVQLAAYVLPLVTLPYLARVLGPAEFGVLVFAQSFQMWLAIVPEYGFGFVGSRDVAANRDDSEALARVAGEILSAQMALVVLTVPFALLALTLTSIFQVNPVFLLFAWVAAVLQGIAPIWFFQGLEQLKRTAAVEIGGRLVATLLIFLLVRDSSDGWVVLAIQAAVSLLGVGYLMVLLVGRARPPRPTVRAAANALRRGWYVFVGHGSASFYLRANTFLLGLLVPPANVAAYAAPEKLTQAGVRMVFPVSQAGYPRMAAHFAAGRQEEALKLFRRLAAVIVASAVTIAGFMFAFAEPLVLALFGDQFRGAVPVMRILALSVPLIAISHVIAAQWLLPQGSDRANTLIALLVGALNVLLVLLLVPIGGVEGMAVAVVLAQLAAVAAFAVAARTTGIPLALRSGR